MYVGMRISFAGRENEKCKTRNENARNREWWHEQGMRMTTVRGGGNGKTEQGMVMAEHVGMTEHGMTVYPLLP
jgi:hypothetical protein